MTLATGRDGGVERPSAPRSRSPSPRSDGVSDAGEATVATMVPSGAVSPSGGHAGRGGGARGAASGPDNGGVVNESTTVDESDSGEEGGGGAVKTKPKPKPSGPLLPTALLGASTETGQFVPTPKLKPGLFSPLADRPFAAPTTTKATGATPPALQVPSSTLEAGGLATGPSALGLARAVYPLYVRSPSLE